MFFVLLLLCNTYTHWFLVHIYNICIYIHINIYHPTYIYIYIYIYMLFYYGLVSYYRINLFITFTKQQWGQSRFFLFERHRLPLFINCDRQAVLCLMFVFLFCNCFVPFVPLISSRNCALFFSVFVNFIFSNFKTILLCLHVIPLVSFNNSFIVNL